MKEYLGSRMLMLSRFTKCSNERITEPLNEPAAPARDWADCRLRIPLFVLAVWLQRGRAERIEEAITYEPEPVHPVTRFCGGDEMRKRGW